jgi:hypothetical protein
MQPLQNVVIISIGARAVFDAHRFRSRDILFASRDT